MVVSYPIIENTWSMGTQRKVMKEILGETNEIPIIKCHESWLGGLFFGKYEAIKYLGKGNCLERKVSTRRDVPTIMLFSKLLLKRDFVSIIKGFIYEKELQG